MEQLEPLCSLCKYKIMQIPWKTIWSFCKNNDVYKANTTPYYLNAKRPFLRNIMIKLSKKNQWQKKNLKSGQDKKNKLKKNKKDVTYKGSPNRLSVFIQKKKEKEIRISKKYLHSHIHCSTQNTLEAKTSHLIYK